MAGLPKPFPEHPQEGNQPKPASPDNFDAAALLTPPPADTPGDGPAPSDAPTQMDQGQATVQGIALTATWNAADANTALDAGAPPGIPIAKFPVNRSMFSPGTVLGHRYEIVRLLGEGGMGAVYKAMDKELDRPVALKVIRPELAQNEGILERFKQELLLARQVTHRNVIRIYDLGEAEGTKFITMEFIEGEDLRILLLRTKKLTPEEAVEIIQQVCRALDAAHSVGVIHRDLKPKHHAGEGWPDSGNGFRFSSDADIGCPDPDGSLGGDDGLYVA